MVGHIEDIVVNKDQQGKKLGLRIIEALDFIAEKVGCYKVRIVNLNWFKWPLGTCCQGSSTVTEIVSADHPRLFRDQ